MHFSSLAALVHANTQVLCAAGWTCNAVAIKQLDYESFPVQFVGMTVTHMPKLQCCQRHSYEECAMAILSSQVGGVEKHRFGVAAVRQIILHRIMQRRVHFGNICAVAQL